MDEKIKVVKVNGKALPMEVARIDMEVKGGRVSIVAEKLMSKNLVVVDLVDFRNADFYPERERLGNWELA